MVAFSRTAMEVLVGAPRDRLAFVSATRTLGGGQRPWRRALYPPDGRYSLYRVVFKEEIDGSWSWTSRTALTEAEARRLFRQAEKALDAM